MLKVKQELEVLPSHYGCATALDMKKALGTAKAKLSKKQQEQKEWDAIYGLTDTKRISVPVEDTKRSVLKQLRRIRRKLLRKVQGGITAEKKKQDDKELRCCERYSPERKNL